MGFQIHISTILCERCGWIMQTYESGDFFCANNKCADLFVPFALRLEMHRKELARDADYDPAS